MILWLAGVAHAACTVFSGAGTVSLPAGDRTDVAVVVVGERIAAVGTLAELGLSGPMTFGGETCAAVDLAGRWLTPGFVAVDTQVGLVEVSMEAATRDISGGGDDVRAALRVADGYNPRSTLVPIARTGGVTSAVLFPEGGVIAGQAAWVDLHGATQAAAVVSPFVAMAATLEGPSLAEGLLRLRELLDDARAYAADPKAFDQNRTRPYAASRLDLEALGPVVRGERPLAIGADRAADLEAILRFAADQKVRVVLVGAAEGWLVAEALAAAKVPVVLDPLVYGAGSFDQVHARTDNPALLAAAGVPVILSPFGAHNVRLAPQQAGNAVRGGLSHHEAMRALTVTPADAFGLPSHGRIEVGAVANLVVWHDLAGRPVDPFEVTAAPERVFVRGEALPPATRQTELLERYRTAPGNPAPLSLP